jgi:N-acetylmuramoyl-L-alanine amidase
VIIRQGRRSGGLIAAAAALLLPGLLPALQVVAEPTALAAETSGASQGTVIPFGSAPPLGSPATDSLSAAVVGMAASPDGSGYTLVAADGGVFTYGSATFHGSATNVHLAAPIVGIALDPATGGYWLAAADGGVFAYDAPFLGSAGNLRLQRPIVGIAPSPDGNGYTLVAADGGIFTYGDATFAGSASGVPLSEPVVGMAMAGRSGYWLAERAVPASLKGKVVVLDPGHNGGNGADPAFINAPVFNGRQQEPCDTTGASTDSGYPESQFNFDVATAAANDLQAMGATVILTRPNNDGVGPCVTVRTQIANSAHADAAVSIHADGGPPDGRGYAVLLPVADGPNDGVIAASDALGSALRDSFAVATDEPVSNYDGVAGLQPRSDLAGTNLTTVPKVFIECANMGNATDAALVVSPAWQQEAAAGIAAGIARFLTSH